MTFSFTGHYIKPMIILNDIHLGVERQAGTTPASRECLREFLFTRLSETLAHTSDDHLLILGDLFDQFEIPARDWVETYLLLSAWCRTRKLTLVAGNHDHSPKALRVSSFEMLADVLMDHHPKNVAVIGIDQWADVGESAIALAHCANQDVFDQKLAQIAAIEPAPAWLLLHANYDNNFAVNSDHSLNVSADAAKVHIDRGTRLIFAHEHQPRKAAMGKITVLGNQWPSSVSDCLENDEKFMHRLTLDSLERIPVWAVDIENGYADVDWRKLQDPSFTCTMSFIRVSGKAVSSEAAEVIDLISKLRQRSNAFVITNAVKVEGMAEMEDLPANFEAAKTIDVVAFIHEVLDERERAAFDLLSSKIQ